MTLIIQIAVNGFLVVGMAFLLFTAIRGKQ